MKLCLTQQAFPLSRLFTPIAGYSDKHEAYPVLQGTMHMQNAFS